MFINKFYRIYTPTTTKIIEPRSSKENFDVLDHKITNVKDGVNLTDVSNMGQTLTTVNHAFVQGKTKYKIIKSTNDNWDAKYQILKNIKTGVDLSDAATVEQTLVYDMKTNKFLFNNQIF